MPLLSYSPRRLEPEAMITADEARAYDRLAVQYLGLLLVGCAETGVNLCGGGALCRASGHREF